MFNSNGLSSTLAILCRGGGSFLFSNWHPQTTATKNVFVLSHCYIWLPCRATVRCCNHYHEHWIHPKHKFTKIFLLLLAGSTDVRTDIVSSVTRTVSTSFPCFSFSFSLLRVLLCCHLESWSLGVLESWSRGVASSHLLIKHPHHAHNLSLSTSLMHPLSLDEK